MNDHIMDTIRATFSQNPTRAAAIVSSTAVLGISIPWFISNFRAFKALGPGGIPYNFRGWLLALFYKPFCLETKGTSVYDLDANKETWLDANVIPERRGARPSISWHPIPHRQLDKIPSVDIQQRLVQIFNARLTGNPGLVEMVTSPHERVNEGLVIHHSVPSPHEVADKSAREIAHIHPWKDYSMHASLAPQDCKLLIERGWAERHPLSGTATLPKEYIMIYAPRDEEELGVVEKIIVASTGYMTGSRQVN